MDNDYINFGYNNNNLRVYKNYKYYYMDACGGGIELLSFGLKGVSTSSIGPIEPPPPEDTLCQYSDSSSVLYVRNIGGQVIAEYNGLLGATAQFIYAGGERIGMIDSNGELHFYLNDHLGSARVIVKDDGTVKDTYDRYLVFGSNDGSTVNTGQSYTYTGKPFDDDGGIGIFYYGARYYDPEIGRFLAVDPLASKYPSWTPYVYTLNNPLAFIDPNGLYNIFINGMGGGDPYVTFGKEFRHMAKRFSGGEDNFGFRGGVGPNGNNLDPINSTWNERFQNGYDRFNADLASGLYGNSDETFKIYAQSMGTAYAEGSAAAIIDAKRTVEFIMQIEPYQAGRDENKLADGVNNRLTIIGSGLLMTQTKIAGGGLLDLQSSYLGKNSIFNGGLWGFGSRMIRDHSAIINTSTLTSGFNSLYGEGMWNGSNSTFDQWYPETQWLLGD